MLGLGAHGLFQAGLFLTVAAAVAAEEDLTTETDRLRERTHYLMSIWPSIVAVLGTLAGALTAGLLHHRSARTARAEERAESHRQDQLGAVTDFAAALDAHRSAMFHRERLTMTEAGTEHQLEAQTRSHDTRAAITAPHIRLQVLVPELAGPAQQAADATYALRRAIDRTELDARRHAAKEASVAFIAAAATLLSPSHR